MVASGAPSTAVDETFAAEAIAAGVADPAKDLEDALAHTKGSVSLDLVLGAGFVF